MSLRIVRAEILPIADQTFVAAPDAWGGFKILQAAIEAKGPRNLAEKRAQVEER